MNALYALIPVPWEKQVEVSKSLSFIVNCLVMLPTTLHLLSLLWQMLLVDEHVEEALSLLEKIGHAGRLTGHIDPLKKRFKQQAAFIYFTRSDLEIALDLFLDSEVDERELVSIFPGLMPSSTCESFEPFSLVFMKYYGMVYHMCVF